MKNNRQIKLRNILKQLRLDNNLNQSDIALNLKKPQSYVSKYESGEKLLNFVEVYELSIALNVRFSDIVNEFEKDINASKSEI